MITLSMREHRWNEYYKLALSGGPPSASFAVAAADEALAAWEARWEKEFAEAAYQEQQAQSDRNDKLRACGLYVAPEKAPKGSIVSLSDAVKEHSLSKGPDDEELDRGFERVPRESWPTEHCKECNNFPCVCFDDEDWP